MGYECRNCGYAPEENELHRGTCPHCAEERREARVSLKERLPLLRIGDSVQVFSTYYHHYNEPQTIMLWKVVGIREDGSRIWKALRGKTYLYDSEGAEHSVYVTGAGYCTPQGKADATRSSWVAHLTLGEMTYQGWFRINQPPYPRTRPTAADLARDRILASVGLEAA